MSRHKGGRPRTDKKVGRGHRGRRSKTRAIELASGLVNTADGKIVEICDSGLDNKMTLYFGREVGIAQERQARNQVARAKRGRYNGYTAKPVGPGGYPAGTYHA